MPYFTMILGDFNVISASWWTNDATTYQGTRIDDLTASYGHQQIISERTHILPNYSSCIEQVFINHGVHPSLLQDYQHQVIHCKLKLKIEYPPPYQRVFWNFRKAKCDSIRKAFKSVNLDLLFSYKDVHQQVFIFSDALINIFTNFVLKKLVTNDDKDPPWMTEEIKHKTEQKNHFINTF